MEEMKDLIKQKTGQNVLQAQVDQIAKEILADPEISDFVKLHKAQLQASGLEKSYSKFLEYIKERDARLKGGEVKSPGMAPVLVMNQGFADVIYKPTPEFLQQKREKELRSRVTSLNMPKNILEAKFSKLEITKERETVISQALAFLQAIQDQPQAFHKGLYLVGNFGVGKTYLLGAMANELAQIGLRTTILHVPTLSLEMKQAIADGDLAKKIETIGSTPILMLDDIGAEMNSAWFRDEVLMVILQYRMLQELPTFFSSNFTTEELLQHLSAGRSGDQDYMKAKRLVERIRFLAQEISFIGENRRK